MYFGDALWPEVSSASYGQDFVQWNQKWGVEEAGVSALSAPSSISPLSRSWPSWKYMCAFSSQKRWAGAEYGAGFTGKAGRATLQGHSGVEWPLIKCIPSQPGVHSLVGVLTFLAISDVVAFSPASKKTPGALCVPVTLLC